MSPEQSPMSHIRTVRVIWDSVHRVKMVVVQIRQMVGYPNWQSIQHNFPISVYARTMKQAATSLVWNQHKRQLEPEAAGRCQSFLEMILSPVVQPTGLRRMVLRM